MEKNSLKGPRIGGTFGKLCARRY